MFDQGLGIAVESAVEGKMVGLWYDPDRILIEGVYCDEVTAYRAKKRWIEALRTHFLLDDGLDFKLKVRVMGGARYFKLQCRFLTACGRYAFWRLTHHQALEVQCILETAHLPRPLCSLSVTSLVNDSEFSPDAISIPLRQERYQDSIDDRTGGWQRMIHSIQRIAHRLVRVTRRDMDSRRIHRELD